MGWEYDAWQASFGASQDAFEWGQEQYDAQMANLRRAEQSRDYYQTNIGSEQQLNAAYSTTFSLGKTPGRRYFQDLGLDKELFNSREARDALYAEQWGGKVDEANSLMQQAMDASKAGDTQTADSLKAQAEALFEGAPMAEWKDRGARGGEGLGKFKGTGIQMGSPIGKQLASPSGQIVGELVHRGEQLLDPESEESQRLISSITEAPLAQIAAGETAAQRALATGERTAQRGMRDLGLATGGMRAPGAEAAIRSATASQFAGQRAAVNTEMAAMRATVIGQARQFYESMAPQYAINAVKAADEWINNRAFINQNYMQLTTSLTQSAMALSGQMASSMASLAGTQYAAASQAKTAAAELEASQKTDWISLSVGAVATVAGAFAGGVGAAAGAAMFGKGAAGAAATAAQH